MMAFWLVTISIDENLETILDLEDGSSIKSSCCSCRGPELTFPEHKLSSSLPSEAPDPEDSNLHVQTPCENKIKTLKLIC